MTPEVRTPSETLCNRLQSIQINTMAYRKCLSKCRVVQRTSHGEANASLCACLRLHLLDLLPQLLDLREEGLTLRVDGLRLLRNLEKHVLNSGQSG